MLSIIIPAHNCADTLTRAVESAVRLNCEKEILVIENGSTDDTADVAAALAQQYDAVASFHSEKGVSRARNLGLEKASGEWVAFLDADDECLVGMEDALAVAEEKQPEILVAGFLKDRDPILHEYPLFGERISGDELEAAKGWMLSRPTLRMQAWAKIFQRELLASVPIRFDEALSYSEDSEFVIRALERCRSLLITDKLVYRYRSGTPSAMRGVSEGRIRAYLDALRRAEEDVASSSPTVRYAFCIYTAAHVNIIAVHDIFSTENQVGWRRKCAAMRDLLREDVVARAVKEMRLKEIVHLQNLPVMLCKLHMIALAGCLFTVRSKQNRTRFQRAEQEFLTEQEGGSR